MDLFESELRIIYGAGSHFWHIRPLSSATSTEMERAKQNIMIKVSSSELNITLYGSATVVTRQRAAHHNRQV